MLLPGQTKIGIDEVAGRETRFADEIAERFGLA